MAPRQRHAVITCKQIYKSERFMRNVGEAMVWQLRAGFTRNGRIIHSVTEHYSNPDFDGHAQLTEWAEQNGITIVQPRR